MLHWQNTFLRFFLLHCKYGGRGHRRILLHSPKKPNTSLSLHCPCNSSHRTLACHTCTSSSKYGKAPHFLLIDRALPDTHWIHGGWLLKSGSSACRLHEGSWSVCPHTDSNVSCPWCCTEQGKTLLILSSRCLLLALSTSLLAIACPSHINR